MLKSYLLIAWRNFRKHKSFSLINVAGLAVGMACFILIMLYVQNELSFDRYHANAERIYRVVAQQPGNIFLGTDHFAVTQAILGPTLKQEFPEVVEATTLDDFNNVLFNVGDKRFYENEIFLADPGIFKIFTFPLLQGDPQTALSEPFTIVLSETMVHKYFGAENPLGKVMRYQDRHDLKVTGVMKDVPKNSHFHPNALLSFKTEVATNTDKNRFTSWGNSSYCNYILGAAGFDAKAFEAKLVGIVKKYHTEDWRDQDKSHRYYLQRLTDIHLYSHIHSLRQEIQPLFIRLNSNWGSTVSARIRAENIPASIEHLCHVWQKYSPNYPFEYFFLDDEFNRMYKAEEKLGAVFGYFTFLAIFIAGLGLFGLASFSAERKTKEIGIRKVLGASLAQLFFLLSKDLVKLILLANLLAWPLAWYGMRQWLQGFAYRTSLNWFIFLATASATLLIALVTVCLQTIKAALANPIESLRYE